MTVRLKKMSFLPSAILGLVPHVRSICSVEMCMMQVLNRPLSISVLLPVHAYCARDTFELVLLYN